MKAMQSFNEQTRLLQEKFDTECIKYNMKYKLVGENAKSPGEALCRTTRRMRKPTSVKRAMLGSVSEYVVCHSYLPVVVVHKKQVVNPFTAEGTNTDWLATTTTCTVQSKVQNNGVYFLSAELDFIL